MFLEATNCGFKPMHPWTRVNLALGLLLLLLLALDRWPTADTPSTPLTTIDPSALQAIRIERGNRLHLALRREGADWFLQHPEAGQAKSGRVELLLAIARAPITYAFAPGSDLSQYGLDKPAAVLRLDAQVLAFGDREPSKEGRYVLVDGEVRVIDDVFFNLLTLPPGHFVED